MKKYRFEIKESEFHGGKHLAYAYTLRNAIKVRGCCQYPDCMCGGAVIIDLDGKLVGDDLVEAIYAEQCRETV